MRGSSDSGVVLAGIGRQCGGIFSGLFLGLGYELFLKFLQSGLVAVTPQILDLLVLLLCKLLEDCVYLLHLHVALQLAES